MENIFRFLKFLILGFNALFLLSCDQQTQQNFNQALRETVKSQEQKDKEEERDYPNRFIEAKYNHWFNLLNQFVLNPEVGNINEGKCYIVSLAKYTTYKEITFRIKLYKKSNENFLDEYEFTVNEYLSPNSRIQFPRVFISKFDEYHNLEITTKVSIIKAIPAN